MEISTQVMEQEAETARPGGAARLIREVHRTWIDPVEKLARVFDMNSRS